MLSYRVFVLTSVGLDRVDDAIMEAWQLIRIYQFEESPAKAAPVMWIGVTYDEASIKAIYSGDEAYIVMCAGQVPLSVMVTREGQILHDNFASLQNSGFNDNWQPVRIGQNLMSDVLQENRDYAVVDMHWQIEYSF